MDLITALTAVHTGDNHKSSTAVFIWDVVCLRRYKMARYVNLFQTTIMNCSDNKLFSFEDINAVAANQTFDNSSGRQNNMDVSISGS